MIYITAAMYCELKPFIDKLNLKRDLSVNRFQLFRNEEVTCVVSGVGKLSAAIATTFLLSRYEINEYDIFVNIGVCGCANEALDSGDIVLCNKIIDNDNQNTYFPDMMFKHDFLEGTLETFSKVVTKDYLDITKGDIVDMEGVGVYKAASLFMHTHQIIILKIVSDKLADLDLNTKDIELLISKKVDVINNWIKTIHEVTLENDGVLSDEDEYYIEKINDNLKLTEYMKNLLLQLSKNYKLYHSNLDLLREYSQVICNNKNEGKINFAKLKDRLMEF